MTSGHGDLSSIKHVQDLSFNIFFEILFTYHKIYPLKVYNSVVCSIHMKLYNDLYNLILELFSLLPSKVTPSLLAVIFYSSLAPDPENHWAIFCLYGLTILDVLCEWNHIICGFSVKLLSLGIMFSRVIMLQYILVFHFFKSLNNIPLYAYTIFCFSIHQLMDIWVVSIFQSYE